MLRFILLLNTFILIAACKTTTKPTANQAQHLASPAAKEQESLIVMPPTTDTTVRIIRVSYKIYYSDREQRNKIEMLDHRVNLGKYDYAPMDTAVNRSRLLITSAAGNRSVSYEINHPLFQPRNAYHEGRITRVFEKTTYKEFIITLPYLSDDQPIEISEIIDNTKPHLLISHKIRTVTGQGN